MALKPAIKKNPPDLKKEAEKNTSVAIKKGKEPPVVIKQGTPLDHAQKHTKLESSVCEPEFRPKVGLNKGITKNMDNYESLRVDCWLTDEVAEGETVQEALDRISKVIDERIEIEVDAML